MLTRVLPGGVMVAAALAMPEFSVGAGDMGRGPMAADPPEPAARPDPARAQRLAGSVAPTHPKLAGVRYAQVIDLGTDTAHAVSRARAQAARSVATGRRPLTEAEQLDRAAALAAAVLNDFTARPGLAIDAALAARMPAASPQPDANDQPAQFSAPAIGKVVDQDAPSPAMAAVAAALDGGALSASAPSAPQTLAATALAAVPASAPAEVAPAAPPASIAAAAPAASLPAPIAVAATAPRPVPAVVAATASARGVIEQVRPARLAAARPAEAAAVAPAQAAVAARVAPVSAAKSARPAASAPVSAPAPAPASAKPLAAAAAAPGLAPALTAPPAAAGAPRIADLDFKSRLLTRIDGRTAGQVDFQQTPAGLKVRLGSVAEVLADRLPAGERERIASSSSANAWFSLAELQAQGIPISYDPVYDEFNIGREDTRPKAARKVHIDQISTPERDAGSATMDQIRRR